MSSVSVPACCTDTIQAAVRFIGCSIGGGKAPFRNRFFMWGLECALLGWLLVSKGTAFLPNTISLRGTAARFWLKASCSLCWLGCGWPGMTLCFSTQSRTKDLTLAPGRDCGSVAEGTGHCELLANSILLTSMPAILVGRESVSDTCAAMDVQLSEL